MVFEGVRRKVIALAGFAILAALAWKTLDPGKVRMVVFVVLGGFALRVLLTAGHSRYDEAERPE